MVSVSANTFWKLKQVRATMCVKVRPRNLMGVFLKQIPLSETWFELNVFIGTVISYWPSNICYWHISCPHSVLSTGALLVFVHAGWPDELTTLSVLFSKLSCSVISNLIIQMYFFHSTYWYSKWSYSLRLCLFPLPSLKCKTAWGQRPCFLVHHSITSAKTGSGTKLSDQYKIIYHVNKWTRVIVPDIMSIVIVINVTKYLFNIVSMVNNTVVYSLK